VDDVLSTIATAAGTNVFGDPGLGSNGVNVNAGEKRGFWLRFSAPTESTRKEANTIAIIIEAHGEP
jgi:hypothetical protein